MNFWTDLPLAEQAALMGFSVSVIMWLGRMFFKDWFSDAGNIARFEKMVMAVLIALVAMLVKYATQGWAGVTVITFVAYWFIAFSTSQGAHALIARTRAMSD